MEGERQRFRLTDRFLFLVEGAGLAEFFSAAAARGVRLRAITPCGKGYRACVWGRDWPTLCTLARHGGWRLRLLRRLGPGCLLLRLTRRAGIPTGAVAFLLLMQAFGGFVWKIDYGPLEQGEQARAAAVLRQCGIFEGAAVNGAQLEQAGQALLRDSGEYGWVSLNFTGGCLFLESTEAQHRQIRATPENTVLYAKADGCVVAVEVESGFAAVKLGQTVAEGQLLAREFRLDRKEQPVNQAAYGRVLGRVQKTYTASCPLRRRALCLTGRRAERRRLLAFGRELYADAGPLPAGTDLSLKEEQCEPLDLLGLALPACLWTERAWERREQWLLCTPEQAAALARRECWKNLYREFPDAAVEAQSMREERDGQGAVCSLTVTFVADIARVGAAAEASPGE